MSGNKELSLIKKGIKERRGFLLCLKTVRDYGKTTIRFNYAKKRLRDKSDEWDRKYGFDQWDSITSDDIIWLEEEEFYKRWFEIQDGWDDKNKYECNYKEGERITYFGVNLATGKISCYPYFPKGLPNPILDYSLITVDVLKPREEITSSEENY